MPPITLTPLSEIPDPPLITSPANFPARADAFLSAFPGLQDELNAFIAAMNAVISGLDQQAPIEAWAPGVTYNFPDVRAGSDGYSYRCKGVDVLDIDPVTDDGTYWVNIGSASSIVGSVVISANASAIPRYLHILAASCTLTLPANPQVNVPISIINLSGTLTSLIDPGTEKINGVSGVMTFDILSMTANLIYSGSTYGWIVL